jgi:hypothetical protein
MAFGSVQLCSDLLWLFSWCPRIEKGKRSREQLNPADACAAQLGRPVEMTGGTGCFT